MDQCPSCSNSLPDGSRFCPSCGAEQTQDVAVTAAFVQPSTPLSGLSAPSDASRGRFLPGTMILKRYRIVGLIGKGGMGEVYRAEDLKLGAPVALKFLPREVAQDPVRLEYFLNEVRLARQITHPNVCRVFDIGDVDQQHFLSMEYVDGENLAGLLRRIGRLPTEKGIQIARQICSGLAAAHEKGVLHRDLKPANIMLDGRGQVRIADFGLARRSATITGDEARAGTPAYMAPEQLSGGEVTVQTDLYALGLVLYEIFTGKAPFKADSVAELEKLQELSSPVSPVKHVPDLSVDLERIILQCLERNRDLRPASVTAVLAALPGGDPLAAAWAAGETPSPEMVADAGEEGTISPKLGGALMAVVLLCLLLVTLLSGSSLYRRVAFDLSPQQLRYEARRVIAKLGYNEPPAASDYKLFYDAAFLSYIRQHDDAGLLGERLLTGQPAAIYLWYVQSPELLYPFAPGMTSPSNPPLTWPGMMHVYVDLRGRLIAFHCVPEAVRTDQSGREQPPDFAALFEAAGLDQSKFAATAPLWNPPYYVDARAAWTGEYPEWPGLSLRVEAGVYQGRPVYFRMIGPWQVPPTRTRGGAENTSIREYVLFALPITALISGGWLARRNWRRGRVDRRGALRIALAVFLLNMARWVVTTHHVPLFPSELYLLIGGLGSAFYWSAIVWVSYLAMEPHMRHHWPWRIISWNRLLAGRFRDPLVGRHVLIAAAVGATTGLMMTLHREIPNWLGLVPHDLSRLPRGITNFLAIVPETVLVATNESLIFVLVFLLATMVFRKEWLAMTVIVVVAMVYYGGRAGDYPWLESGFVAVIVASYLTVFLRFGILPVIVGLCYHWLIDATPFTTDFSAWYAGQFALSLVLLLGIAAYGLVTSIEGQRAAA